MKPAIAALDAPTKQRPSPRARTAASPPGDDAGRTGDALLTVMNRCGRFVQVNATWSDVLGWSPADVAQRAFLDLVHPDDVSKASCALAALSYGETIQRLDLRCRGSDGSYRTLSWRARPRAGKFLWEAERGEGVTACA